MFEKLIHNVKECFKPVEDNVKVVSPPEPESKEQIEIEVEGSYKFDVRYTGTMGRHELVVYYDVVASFGLYMIPLKSNVLIDRPKSRGRVVSHTSTEMSEEEAYQFILKTLRGDTVKLRNELERSIRYELESELDKRDLKELKKQVKLNKSYSISFSFNVDKTERYK